MRVLALACCVVLGACQGSDIQIFAPAAAAGEAGGGAGGTAGTAETGGGGLTDAGANGGAPTDSSGAGGIEAGGSSGSSSSSGAGGAAGGSAAAGTGGMPCTTNDECPAAWLCRKSACGEVQGHCEVRPVFCDDNLMPVCGCDHVTYWNECYRKRAGQAASSPEDCTDGVHPCYTSADCASGAYCQHLLPRGSNCTQTVGAGTCWVTPDVCSMQPDQLRWRACGMSGPDAGPGCVSTCAAVQSERPYVSVPPNGSCF